MKGFGLDLFEGTIEEALEEILDASTVGSGVQLVVTMNVDHLCHLYRNPLFRSAYQASRIVTVDGTPLAVMMRIRAGKPFERITGADLFAALLNNLRPGKHRPFFVVASQAAKERIVERNLERGFEACDIGVHVPPHGFERDQAQSAFLIAEITSVKPTHVFFGVGSPKSETWMFAHRAALGDFIGLSVGAAIEFACGLKKRAPRWVQVVGLEWLWRALLDPSRLGPRYARNLCLLPILLTNELRGKTPFSQTQPERGRK
ncbi:WecB/TagA/CpsF family glycosyltransferase [Roseibium sp.]|uniref:WecB/TagA/CpsF family glycosyltransferase n=1 Tax=Roseibium sp. TaxID=1936156 RepID=UPI0032970486